MCIVYRSWPYAYDARSFTNSGIYYFEVVRAVQPLHTCQVQAARRPMCSFAPSEKDECSRCDRQLSQARRSSLRVDTHPPVGRRQPEPIPWKTVLGQVRLRNSRPALGPTPLSGVNKPFVNPHRAEEPPVQPIRPRGAHDWSGVDSMAHRGSAVGCLG